MLLESRLTEIKLKYCFFSIVVSALCIRQVATLQMYAEKMCQKSNLSILYLFLENKIISVEDNYNKKVNGLLHFRVKAFFSMSFCLENIRKGKIVSDHVNLLHRQGKLNKLAKVNKYLVCIYNFHINCYNFSF